MATSTANSILGTIDMFQRQQQRNFQNNLALAELELARQREDRLGQVQDAQLRNYNQSYKYADTAEARAVTQEEDRQETHGLDIAAKKLANQQGQVNLDTSKLALKDAKTLSDRTNRAYNSSDEIRMLDANRWIDRSKQPVAGASVYTDEFYKAIGEGDKNAMRHLVDQAGQALMLEDGLSVSSIQVMPVGEDGIQRYAINTNNGGVITEDGSSNPDSAPIIKTADELDRLLSTSLRSTALADVVDTASANVGYDIGQLSVDERSARQADELSAAVNQATKRVTQALSQNPTEEGKAALRYFNQSVTDINAEGGDAAVLEFVNSFTQGDEQAAAAAEPDAQQSQGPVAPGQTAPEPFQSQADTLAAREREESASQRQMEGRRTSGAGAFRGELSSAGNRGNSLEKIDPLLEDIRREVASTKTGFFKSRRKSTAEETTAEKNANSWYEQNADALGQRFANAPDALHTEITALGAVGFYNKYKDSDIANFSPEVLGLNAKLSDSTGNTVAGTKEAIKNGTLPTPTVEEIAAVREQLVARGFTNESTLSELDKLQAAEIPGLMAVMMGMTKNPSEQLAILKGFENRIQTGNMSTTPDAVARTNISAGNLRLAQDRLVQELRENYQEDADDVVKLSADITAGLINDDGTFKAEPDAATRSKLNRLVTYATGKGFPAGTRAAANDAILPLVINYLSVAARDKQGFLDALAFWRNEGTLAIGDIRDRIRVTPDGIELLDGKGGKIEGGSLTKREATEYLAANVMKFLDTLESDPGS